MKLNRALVLGLVLVSLGQAVGNSGRLPAKEHAAPLGARLQQAAPPVLQPAAPAKGKTGDTVIPAPAAHPANAQASPSKEERLADWRDLPALEAYRLFKELGRELPRELALQFNASLEVNVYNGSLRQAGGSPMTALQVGTPTPGDSYSDSGSTVALSNYLGNVVWNGAPCAATSGFDGNDAWYTFTLAAPIRVYASLCAGAGGYDTLLGIFNTSLDMVASNDDACGGLQLQSSLTCCLDEGTYYVVVDGYGGAAGPYDLELDFSTCPSAPVPTRGGPDAFGYSWTITGDSQATPFEWQDIRPIGTAVTLGDDEYTVTPVALPFPFPFYGVEYTQIRIGSNGLVGFEPTGLGTFTNSNLPDAATPNALIAAFWDDLNPSAGGTIHTYAEPVYGRFIIQFTNVPAFPNSGSNTFQIVLNKGGDIVIHHLDLTDNDTAQATVGIEGPGGTQGIAATFDGSGAALGDQKTVHFHYPSTTAGGVPGGYTWTSSQAVDGPQHYFVDISGATDLDISRDDTYMTQALPFPFPFHGIPYDSVSVSSNGVLTFGQDENFGYENGALPDVSGPDNMICVFWDDLDAGEGGAVYYDYDLLGNRVIFQWQAVAHNGDYYTGSYACHFTFQAVLYPDGTIDLNYRDMSGYYTGSATVGVENGDGTLGVQATLDGSGASTMDGTTIRFRAPQPRPTRGGPAAGYEWANSLDPAGPGFQFSDISGTGSILGLTGDNQAVSVVLPFAFPWFGSLQSQVRVCTNGWLSFDPAAPADHLNGAIPSPTGVNNMICAFWDDLYLPTGSRVYYRNDSANGRVILQWNQVRHTGSLVDGPYTFQVMLYSNGEILINYGNMGAVQLFGVTSATVGLETGGGTDGLQVNCNDTGGLIAGGVTVAISPVYSKPAAITDLRIVQDAVPEAWPFLYHYEWSPVTRDINGNTLVADHYDMYYTTGQAPYAPFPSGWSYYGTFVNPYTPTLQHYMNHVAVRIVAVDTSGYVVRGESPPGSRPLRAETLRTMARPGDGTVLRLVQEPPLR